MMKKRLNKKIFLSIALIFSLIMVLSVVFALESHEKTIDNPIAEADFHVKTSQSALKLAEEESSQSELQVGEATVETDSGSVVKLDNKNTAVMKSDTKLDKYLTDPTPEGKPSPIEPQNVQLDKKKVYSCTLSISCNTILDNVEKLDPEKEELVPGNGIILPATTIEFYEGESVFDVLCRTTKENKIHLEYVNTPVYNSAYIEGIHNLYEFDCGELSGWMYKVNNWFPNYGCSRYQLKDGDVVEWLYTCDLGRDIGGDYATGGE